MTSPANLKRMRWFMLAGVVSVACGGHPKTAAETPRKLRDGSGTLASRSVPAGSLDRADVVQIVDGGLGRFLQRVQLEPSLDGGRFVGFRVLSLHPANFWSGVDIAPGDVVTSVNGQKIEQAAQAFEVFESLRTASELRVQLRRGPREKQLIFPIVGVAKSASGQPVPQLSSTR